ncbi:MAG: WbqC family protein [Nanoarchaeota archaeon]|nr:WbqC family protein [Nanoarchaeota archaeon]
MFLKEGKMSKVLSAHQPNFLPYLGFFDKMQSSDIFVIRDEVLFIKKEYHNRNKIRINSHDNVNNPMSKWISAPVHHQDDFIKHILIQKEIKQKNIQWYQSILHEIEASYSKAPYFKTFFPEFQKIFNNSETHLLSLNMKVINLIKEIFQIKTPIILASQLKLKPDHYEKSAASVDIANICQALNADIYLSGSGGRTYLNLEPFNNRKIKVEFQDYHHPKYEQHLPGFLPYMASIDALFCIGRMPQIDSPTIFISNTH